MTLGEIKLGSDAARGEKQPGARLEIANFVLARLELREAPANVGGGEHLVWNAKPPRDLQSAANKVVLASVGLADVQGADDQAACGPHEDLAGLGLDLAPQAVRPQGQRSERVAFADRLTGDSAMAVARAKIMGRTEPIDAQNCDSAPSEVVQRCAADRAQSHDNDLGGGCHHRVVILGWAARGS